MLTRNSASRRHTLVWVAVVTVSVASACTAGVSDGPALLRRAVEDATVDAWTFVDRPDAEQLLECVAGFEAVTVTVDLRGSMRMSIGRDGNDEDALWFEDVSYVRGALLGASAAEWVRVRRNDSETVGRVESALGPSLSSWVLADRLPPASREIVGSALDFADRVEVLPSSGPTSTTTVRVSIDERRVAELADTNGAGYPTLTFSIEDGDLAAVAARPSDDADSFGFRWEYEPVGERLVGEAPTDWIDASDVTITRSDNRGRTCEIGP
jgi:hypothetical protein